MSEYRQVLGVDGTRFYVPYNVVDEYEFEYVSVELFNAMTDFERTRYISDLHLYEMRYYRD